MTINQFSTRLAQTNKNEKNLLFQALQKVREANRKVFEGVCFIEWYFEGSILGD